MIEFILILHIWTGAMSDHESQSMAVVPGFKTIEECRAAGREGVTLATGVRAGKFVCVSRTK